MRNLGTCLGLLPFLSACSVGVPPLAATSAATTFAPSSPDAPPAAAAGASEAILAPWVVAPEPSAKRVIGYFTNWAHIRPEPCRFTTEDTPVELLTHVNYAFASVIPSADRRSFELGPSSPEDEARLFAEVNALKTRQPGLRTLLSVGGWAFNDEPTAWIFTSMAESAERRGHFARQTARYLRTHGFDGLDIDWEFPGAAERGGRPEDAENFTRLLGELRAHFHEEAKESGRAELLLTIAAPAGLHFYQHQQVSRIHESLDWINLMTYDYHGDWDGVVGDNAPLVDRGPDVEESVAAYLAMGVPRGKLVLGFATYARAFGGVARDARGEKSTAPGPQSPCGKDSLSAHHVEAWIRAGTYRRVWDPTTLTPHAYDARGQVWISYDDRESYAAKLDFLERERLGGGMFWAIDQDDVRGGYPLIRQVSERLLGPRSSAADR